MSDSKHNKGTSVAAFMFMPQFHLCFRGAAHIVPVFMRTLALMFVQAGLIDRNHPASRYGIEGVKKYSFAALMGEAWFSLRSQRADARQWGLFISVIMMIAVFIAAIVTFMMNVFFGLGTAAYAQIFSHPGTPYAGAGSDTDIAKMGAAIGGAGSAPLFDIRTAYEGNLMAPNTSAASADLGLMLLDKVLRQATVGNGGALQSGLTGLMQIYNTGVLVVAAVMIFWMILSIVVDTAKTGTIGGGRHNMVWTPIRVVFALGIMIPLGTTGFSSGQFAVMKLAEWGSNFGTRAWSSYVTGVINGGTPLLSPFSAESATSVVHAMARLKTCQVAWNAEAVKQGNASPSFVVERKAVKNNRATGTQVVSYTNNTAPNLCGSLEYTQGGLMASLRDVSALTAGMQRRGGVADNLHTATENFLDQMRDAVAADLQETSVFMRTAHGFGCAFVGKHMAPNDGTANPVDAAGVGCGGAVAPPPACPVNAEGFPTLQCHQDMVGILRGSVTARYGTAQAALTGYITGPLVADMTNKGWAGMGVWTYYLKVLNDLALQARKVNVTVYAGELWTQPSQDWQGGNPPTIEEFVKLITTDYDRWWDASMTTNESQQAAYADRNAALDTRDVNVDDFHKDTKSAKKGKGIVQKVMKSIMPDQSSVLGLFHIANGDDVYPFTRLVEIGRNIMGLFGSMLILLSVLQYGLGYFTGGVNSALANLLNSGLMMGVMAGAMISFYIPILPLIRTTFAAMTWIISVFEAVVMVPIAALNFLTSVGEGMGAREVWILWLNVLMRPVLVVIGYVGATLVFNAFAIYFSTNFANGMAALYSAGADDSVDALFMVMSYLAYTVIYVGAIYTAANTTFKMLDMIPDAMMRWIGGRADTSFTDDNSAGMMYAAAGLAQSFKTNSPNAPKPPKDPKDITPKA
ncbi:MAG: DotA/TraY family protein [Alphaproteobacteria bacterium]|nr:DotA/TraY family protein [Alphaproteobacteria bacterium]